MKKNMVITIALSIILIVTFSIFAIADASSYLQSYRAGTAAEGSGKILISYDVVGTGQMTSIGVTQIEVQKKVSNSWVQDSVLYSSNYPSFLKSNDYSHSYSVRVIGVAGTQYRAVLTFYAADSTGSDSKNYTTSTVTCY